MSTELLARCEARGLGYQTHAMWRHLPLVPLVVEVSEPGWPCVLDYGEARRVDPHAPIPTSAEVVFSAETFYDPTLAPRVRAEGGRPVLHVNPEFFVAEECRGAELWLPTPWMAPAFDAEIVPVPVERALTPRPTPERPVILHVQGRPALGDRNGTSTFYSIAAALGGRFRVRVASQGHVRPGPWEAIGPVRDRWSLYEEADLLVLPRRYGGLSLVVQEAMASGLAVAMTDCPPNDFWPVIRLPARPSGRVRTKAGHVLCHDVDVGAALAVLRSLTPEAIDAAKAAAHRWALAHTWERLRPLYEERLCR
ncbi:MAG: hypothetical protein KatS3mg014_2541 [Actinomycetota bacterium]|nr:MAG: hypothetical protein KatS3mg014_2464 [Actinomycetota bacterium]GIV00926.1 MAG: hypothetical protein KatS3mg014_2541 [Actinomycetota bacterium]